MPPLEVIWFLVLLNAICYVASTCLLRIGCVLANYVGRKTGWGPQLFVPRYWAALGIVFGAIFVLGMFESMASLALEPLVDECSDQPILHVVAWILRAVVFAMLVSSGLRCRQRSHSPLIKLASFSHLVLLCFFLMLVRGMIMHTGSGERPATTPTVGCAWGCLAHAAQGPQGGGAASQLVLPHRGQEPAPVGRWNSC